MTEARAPKTTTDTAPASGFASEWASSRLATQAIDSSTKSESTNRDSRSRLFEAGRVPGTVDRDSTNWRKKHPCSTAAEDASRDLPALRLRCRADAGESPRTSSAQ